MTAQLAIDSSTNCSYSDLVWQDTIWSKLNNNMNWRIYFDTINNFLSYQTSFNLIHSYSWIGLYNLTITIVSTNATFAQIVNVTDGEIFSILTYSPQNILIYILIIF